MIPIPQYPLYTATIAEYNAYGVSQYIPYNLHVRFFVQFFHARRIIVLSDVDRKVAFCVVELKGPTQNYSE